MHLASQKIIFCVVSTRGKVDPHVAPPISLTIGENPTPYGILALWAVNGLSIVYWVDLQ